MEVRVPAIAEGVTSGTVVSIAVKVGDAVKEGDTICELETNKAVAPIPSTGSGTVSKVHISEGQDVAVGAVLVTLGGEASSAADSEPSEKKSEGEAQDQ